MREAFVVICELLGSRFPVGVAERLVDAETMMAAVREGFDSDNFIRRQIVAAARLDVRAVTVVDDYIRRSATSALFAKFSIERVPFWPSSQNDAVSSTAERIAVFRRGMDLRGEDVG